MDQGDREYLRGKLADVVAAYYDQGLISKEFRDKRLAAIEAVGRITCHSTRTRCAGQIKRYPSMSALGKSGRRLMYEVCKSCHTRPTCMLPR
jgi:HEAT repeat protein